MPEDVIFTATINLGNDAMRTPEQVASALRKIAHRIELYEVSGFTETIYDENGNNVGTWKLGPR